MGSACNTIPAHRLNHTQQRAQGGQCGRVQQARWAGRPAGALHGGSRRLACKHQHCAALLTVLKNRVFSSTPGLLQVLLMELRCRVGELGRGKVLLGRVKVLLGRAARGAGEPLR